MSATGRAPHAAGGEKQLDPVAILRRDNTLLEMLAAGFRRLASALEQKGPLDPKRIAEGIEIHRLFLVETHHQMIQMVDRVLESLPGAPLKAARLECHKEHAAAQASAQRLSKELEAVRAGEAAARGRLRDALLRESERWTAHARSEEENLFSQLPDAFRKKTQEEVGDEVRKFRAASAAIEERLSSWTSGWGAASD